MPKVACPGCGATYTVPENIGRRNVKCRGCQTSFPVGEPQEQNPFAGMTASGSSAPGKNPAISVTPIAKKPAAPGAAAVQASKADNVQVSEAGGPGLGVSQKVAAIVKDPKRRKWLA